MSESFSTMRDVSQRLIDQLTSSHTDLNDGTETVTITHTNYDSSNLQIDERSKHSLPLEQIEEGQRRNRRQRRNRSRSRSTRNQRDKEAGTEADTRKSTLENPEEEEWNTRSLYLWLAVAIWFLLAVLIIVPTHVFLKKATNQDAGGNEAEHLLVSDESILAQDAMNGDETNLRFYFVPYCRRKQ